MFFNKEKKKSGFVKAKTPEARKKQKQAIASYYAKKKNRKFRNNLVAEFSSLWKLR